tara:strand:- start:90 stop:917 length:828 start_codon:yes stop_codon:yes gene_type:complete
MSRKKITVYDFLQTKNKRQLSAVAVRNIDEALAAEEAGIDIICATHDAPDQGIYSSFDELKRIREAAPNCFMQSGGPTIPNSEYEAIKFALKYLSIGVDCVYGGLLSEKWIRAMRKEFIPINSHVGLIPGKQTWIGGYRAIGKTSAEAIDLLEKTISLQDAGVIGVELEVVPTKVAKIITEKVDIITISMGSGSNCDGQYLYGNDILGYTEGRIPRHARIYRNFKNEFKKLQKQRIDAFKEFHDDTIKKKFNDPSINVDIDEKEFEKFLKQSEKL